MVLESFYSESKPVADSRLSLVSVSGERGAGKDSTTLREPPAMKDSTGKILFDLPIDSEAAGQHMSRAKELWQRLGAGGRDAIAEHISKAVRFDLEVTHKELKSFFSGDKEKDKEIKAIFDDASFLAAQTVWDGNYQSAWQKIRNIDRLAKESSKSFSCGNILFTTKDLATDKMLDIFDAVPLSAHEHIGRKIDREVSNCNPFFSPKEILEDAALISLIQGVGYGPSREKAKTILRTIDSKIEEARNQIGLTPNSEGSKAALGTLFRAAQEHPLAFRYRLPADEPIRRLALDAANMASLQEGAKEPYDLVKASDRLYAFDKIVRESLTSLSIDPTNEEKALSIYQAAADLSHTVAVDRFELAYKESFGKSVGRAKALALLEKSDEIVRRRFRDMAVDIERRRLGKEPIRRQDI